MEVDKKSRDDVIAKITKLLDNKLAKDIETSIYDWSKQYAEIHDTPYIVQNIYESKSDEILCLLNNSKSDYLISGIKTGKIKANQIAFLKDEELNPEKYEDIVQKRNLEEYKKNNTPGTNAFTCPKCKKSNSDVETKQTRAGDEPPTIFITCKECGHVKKLN
jgi:DNA-directed RNA polymerase subunit M/transcription elongation factor TFIIS